MSDREAGGPIAKLATALDERLGARVPSVIVGGASFAYTAGAILTFLLVFEALTGIALAAFYAPTGSDAWASVAYIEDQTTWGHFVRGAHHHGGGAIVIVAGLHLVQTALAGAYKRPRELVWWLGILLLMLVLAWAITGYILPWDQAGFWANQVEVGIAAGTPIVGDRIKELALGGNDYGNLTLTRFYALHVGLLPAVVTALTVLHIKLARRHGTTSIKSGPDAPRWPDQTLRDAIATAAVVALLITIVVSSGGAPLAGPADPATAYDARPLWYFRWLYELRELAGSAEQIAAMVAPAVVGGFFVSLPLLDRKPDRAIKARLLWLGAMAGFLALIAALTMMSFARDSSNTELAERQAKAEIHAARARYLAKTNGVPASGAIDVFTTVPMYTARTLWAKSCKGCHEDAPPGAPADQQRKGPRIGPGHGNRVWLAEFLKAPSGDAFWGRTKLGKDPDAAMPAYEATPEAVADMAELLYAESGAMDIDKAKQERGKAAFETACGDCHSLEEGVAGSGPGLAKLGSRDWYFHYISNPHAAVNLGDKSEMPRFDQDLTVVERDALAGYLVWLRTATAQDLAALGPL